MASVAPPFTRSFTLYTFEYDLEGRLIRMDGFWEEQVEVRYEIELHRLILLREGRVKPLPEMRIIELQTIPVDRKAIVDLLNEQHEGLEFFFLSQRIVDVISLPQAPG